MNPDWKNLLDELTASGYLKTPRIIDAFKKIDRVGFVLPEYKEEAYGNYPAPIGEGQTISQPLTVAFMLELLTPKPGEKILDVGHGSGWQTALLAEIVGENGKVIAIERITSLCSFGTSNVAAYGFIKNGVVKTICGDAYSGATEYAPFDKIIAAATSSKEIPASWKEQLKVGGIIVAPVGSSIWRFTKKTGGEWQEEEFPGFTFVPLVNKSAPEEKSIEKQRVAEKHHRYKQRLLLPLLLFMISCVFSYTAYALFAKLPLAEKKIDIEVREGAGAKEIGSLLKEKSIIRSKWLFVGWVILAGKTSGLKHGIYEFGGGLNIPEVTARLAKGERFSNEVIITIPEGWNINDIAEYLSKEEIVAKEDFLSAAGKPRRNTPPNEIQKNLYARFTFLAGLPSGTNLEGYLFPDTYRVFRKAGAENITKKMLENFDKKLSAELRAEIDKKNKSMHQIITMASLIEKEVRSEEDRAMVSGVLWKRLELGIGLQVDATIAYISEKKSSRILYEDLAVDSPYNTYKYRGLPPGPIANPGLSAIKAALYPKSSPYLYYLSAEDGTTIFSKTLEEHNIAKAKYLK